MGKLTKEELFQTISIAITVILSIFKNETNAYVIIPIIALLIIVVIISIIMNKTKENKNLSNTAVISKSKKYTKMLALLIKQNAKVLKKYNGIRGFKRLEKTNKQVLKKVQGRKKTSDVELEKLKIKFSIELDKYYDKSEIKNRFKIIRKQIPYCSQEQAYEVHKIVYKNLKDLRRILLQLEQHQLRIKLGNYIVKYSFDILEQINAYIDDIGWTHILLGDNKKGVEVIKMAINLIDYKIKGINIDGLLEDEREEYFNLLLLKARALRHLGTTYYTYKSYGKKVGDYLKEALEICNNIDFKQYYLTTTIDNKKKYCSMIQGIEYNIMLFEYYEHLKNNDLSDGEFKKMYVRTNEMIDELYELKKEDIVDKHRLIKLLTFRSQIYNEIVDKEFKEKNEKTLEKDLMTIEKILNGNIYFDEALEAYLYQKIEKIYDDVNYVFHK